MDLDVDGWGKARVHRKKKINVRTVQCFVSASKTLQEN